MTNLTDTRLTSTTVESPAGAADGFEALMAEHAQTYRLPVGALVHPETVTVPDPHAKDTGYHPADVRRLKKADRKVRWGFAAFIPAAVGFLSVVDAEPAEPVSIAAMVAVGLTGGWTTLAGFRRDEVIQSVNRAAEPSVLSVPADVAAAHRAYQSAPVALRNAHAAEAVTGAVEDQSAYMDTLLVEAARLHAMEASTTPEALAVRDTMVRLAAQAQALTTLAERNRALINAATLTTPMLLAQQPSHETFHAAAAIMGEETTLVRGVLNTQPGFEALRPGQEPGRDTEAAPGDWVV